MADEISYFEVAAFLAEIEPDYAKYLDPIEWKQRLVLAARERWPTRVTREGKRRWPSTGSVAKILAATGASLAGIGSGGGSAGGLGIPEEMTLTDEWRTN